MLERADVFVGQGFQDTADRVRQGAFAITADLEQETVEDIRTLLADNLATGPDPKKFAKDVSDLMDEGTGLSEARIDMVFRNNMQAAISNGADRAVEAPLVSDAFPYRRYFATTDQRVREEHFALEKLGLSGTAIYRANDPVWSEFRPPWGFNCRCAWSPVSITQAARAGVQEAKDWLARAKALAKERGGRASDFYSQAAPQSPEFVPHPPFQPDPSFRRDVI